MNIDYIAKAELKAAWEKVQALEVVGKEFGELCYKWHKWYIDEKPKDKGDRIRFMWKSLGIPHTRAYAYMAMYAESAGLAKTPEKERYTDEEMQHNEQKALNETRLMRFFEGCDLPLYIKQNCAT